ncbi:MAG TPA: adenylate/guanylate cyclase domain-containing protein [Anaerolineales bacterium]|nr:adenylate/guanylate cyclase domain-containing protein [Anaerolineales bacterium]
MASLRENRSLLGDEVVEAALAAMQEKLARLDTEARPSHEPQQRKLVTVMFADVSGFTAMAETMDHEIVSTVINSLWSRVDMAIVDHKGRIDKHIGDAVMALFGTPVAHEDDPERAIRAALEIQAVLQEWQEEFADSTFTLHSQPPNIQLRIGINTGPALLGTVGTLGEYTAIGDTVNLASRIEQAAPLGGILISQYTYHHVRGIFNVTALEPMNVKGKSDPIQVYIVNGFKPKSFRDTTRGVEGIETRMIGRDAELGRMKDAYETSVRERQTCLISLVAEAGMGKSRLLFEFGKWLDAQQHSMHIFKGRATQEMNQIPYALLRDIFSASFEIQDHDRAAIARQKLERGILSHVKDGERAEIYSHFIGHLIGFDYSTSPHLQGILGDARQVRDLAFHYAVQLFSDIAQDHAIVFFLEDIHFADQGSLDFFDHLFESTPNLPLLTIGLTRSSLFDHRPGWGTGPVQNVRLDLLSLSEHDSRLLVSEILKKVGQIPSVLIDMIVTKAEGSPFYAEELIRVLLDKGVIMRGETEWQVRTDRLSELQVPATLTGLVQARLDSLNTGVLETLQQASVVGRIFWLPVVETMRNPESHRSAVTDAIREKLQTLRSKELVFQYQELSPSEAQEYIFRNIILHDVTYESVLLKLRPVYHMQAAEGLINLGGERIGEYAGRVGEHYERAGEWLKAADWYGRAGRQAQVTYEPNTAIRYYQKSLGFLGAQGGTVRVTQRLEIFSWLGEVLNWQARYGEAIDNFSTMLNIAGEYGDILFQSRALHGLSISLTYQGDHRPALESAIRSEELARSIDARPEIARALWAQGSSRYRLGEPQAVLSLGEQALAINTELNDKNEMGRCLNLLGAAHYTMGRYQQAESYWQQALNIFQELGNRQQGMDLLSNLGVIADARGDYETALQRYDSALGIAREIGNRDGEIVFLSNHGIEQVALKNYAAAESDLREVIRLVGVTGSWILPNTYNYYAEALLGLGSNDQAAYFAQQGLVQSIEDGSLEYLGGAWRVLGLVAAKTGMPIMIREKGAPEPVAYDAPTCFAKSGKIFAEAEIHGERARTLREWAKYEIHSGDREEGEKLWREARDIFVTLGAHMEVERMSSMPD